MRPMIMRNAGLQCPYGCCLDYNRKNGKSVRSYRRKVKRSERNEWKRTLPSG